MLLRTRRGIHHFLEQSEEALSRADTAFFAKSLPRKEWWRLYPSFESRAVFLDIETTGLSQYYDEITLVGLYDGKRVSTLLAGQNLNRLSSLLKQYDIVVTFNGTLFDIPFLKTKFPELDLPSIHIDLRYLLKRLGHVGGLKEIEEKLGIRRTKNVNTVDGLYAPVLWARYIRGDIEALQQLVRYNAADITSLQSLIRYSCRALANRLLEVSTSRDSVLKAQRPRRINVEANRIGTSKVRLVVGRDSTYLRPHLPKKVDPSMEGLLQNISIPNPRVIGIDLRATEVRPTGWALLFGEKTETQLLRTDEQIIQATTSQRPDLISIDSPLGLPIGRCCTKDSCKCRSAGILRGCERTLWKRGVRVFPCLLPSMQRLTERGIRLASEFRRLGFKVIESYPGAAQDIMRIPRKRSSLDDLRRGLADFGIKGTSGESSHDELDAITSAVVGYFYLAGEYESLGNPHEEYLIIPQVHRHSFAQS